MTNTGTGDLDQNLFTLFARQADRRPDATAVLDENGATTYGALLTRACVIADALTQRGLGAEQPVGVLMKRTSDLLATLLGVLAAGGCYVPLDPEEPPERSRCMIDGAKCRLVLGHKPLIEEFRSRLRSAGEPVDHVELVDIEHFASTAANAAFSEAARLPNAVAPGGHRLAYILFTSGSTGTPKGVAIEHLNVVNLVLAGRDLFGFTESDRWLATSTVAFDLSVAELFLPLVTGGVVVLRDRRLLQDPHGLVKVIREHGITMFQTVPSVWAILLAEILDFPRIRVIATTGEAAGPELGQRLVNLSDEVWNLYGPTETTVWATGHRIRRNETGYLSASIPIGRPLANMEARVLDEQGTPVPAGTEGELWIGGAGVSRGYCGNEQLTRERFAVLGQDGGRFYRTGDVVAADHHGTFHYFGRCDDQMKVRGVRIEPMEVEAAILKYPGVTQAATTWYATASGSRSIVAAVVASPGHSVNAEELHRFLARLLPSAMVPSRFVFCEALPASPGGKIDRKAIRARVADLPADPGPASGEDAVTETERALIGIWERTLKIRPVARGDHFFSIGGDSLSAVTMMLEVEATFGISLAFRVAFESPTLKRLAERIDRTQAPKSAASIKNEDLSNAAFVFPLAQQGSGTPVFFNNVDLRMARKGMWSVDCPLYSVSQWAQGSGFTKAKSVEELARVQIDGIRSIQPHGPYRLAGYSFGGLVALEIAHQLRRAGETIDLLFLLDPSEPFYDSASATGAPERLGARIKRHMRHVASNPRGALRYVGLQVLAKWDRFCRRPAWEWICYHLVHLYGRHPSLIATRLLPSNRWPAFWYTTQRLARTYNPKPYDGEAFAMFLCNENRRHMWQKLLAPTADMRSFDSDHGQLFDEPALSLWLEPVRACLEGKS